MIPEENQQAQINSVLDVFKRCRKFLITSHVHPDGDNIGSMLAVAWILDHFNKDYQMVLADPVPAAYAFLPETGRIKGPEECAADFDAAIILDCGELDRIGDVSRCLSDGMALVNIDHHLSNGEFTIHRYVRPEASATGELIYDLLGALGLTPDAEVAMALYTAILTDTGTFRFANTTARTLEMGARLLAAGVSPSYVAEQVYDTKPLAGLKLLGEVLDTLEVSPCGRIAWLVVTRAMLDKYHVTSEETEGFVNYARSIEGVQVGLLFREQPGGGIKVSWRSRGNANVSAMAARFGGGGHARAAGCEINARLPEAIKRVLAVVREALDAGR
ncbi:MAG: bifunctional oligoribonuclease/PAP phosphatase NrnA [Firmicutes bacterium]|nr:bifunctional oligoribonuclease/PAP phosphatase NrnA [Bacillota bacterium]